ncbi:MAG: cobalamin-dependent protein [Anaerolineales bacterium]|nr:cobalamin-dependent protein [Anaerolineales bacterium]
MRIAFVDAMLRFSIPLGITSVAACLRAGGHEVRLFIADSGLDEALNAIRAYNPDAVAFSVISGSHRRYFEIAAALKRQLGVLTLWGGPHPTFFPEMIELPFVDLVCIGEGEDAAAELADAYDALGGKIPSGIRNFWVKQDGRIQRNPVRPRIRDLDRLPWPARDLYYAQSPVLFGHGIKHFMAHRGCPYACTYCFNHSYNRLYREQAGDARVIHSRSPDSIVAEILFVQSRVPMKMAAFVDDVFTIDRGWILRFAEVYARLCRIPFSINARFDNIDPEITAALAGAGLCLVYAGVEAGNEHIRNGVMKRRMSEQSMAEAAALFRKHGIKLLTENILGTPGETFEQAAETLGVNIRLRPAVANASIFSPYPKLEMTRFAVEHGFFDGDPQRLDDNYYHGSALKFSSERDKTRIVNLRCFFSLLSHHPRMLPFIRPLLEIRPNPVFRWIGDLIDGYYLKTCLPYGMSVPEFFATLKHFLTHYRRRAGPAVTAQARTAGIKID